MAPKLIMFAMLVAATSCTIGGSTWWKNSVEVLGGSTQRKHLAEVLGGSTVQLVVLSRRPAEA